ncbi:MAG: PASTA domain-containing protein [Dactylosporangium sp.]|nr:transglycosylase domain-containing protein [Dactylosporangium sp.]NNJ63258.1 PASTA domain-containing protein [Dactylosporangium sp.]
MRTRDRGLITNAASLLLCGLLAGLVVAAAAFPVLAMAGLTAKAGADTFEQMPTDFDIRPSSQISNVFASDGTTQLASLYDENRRDVKLSDVAPVMQQAMVAAEDKSFYKHRGVDLKGVARAFVKNQQTGSTEGASTLTMQYVRQVIQYSAKTPQQVIDATEQTPARKIREMKYAIALEKELSKEEVLERYLNIAAFGESAYGVWAASQVYFAKPPAELALAEAALLASLVKAPTTYNPASETGKPLALERSRNYTLKNMLQMGFITQTQYDEAVQVEPTIVGKRPPQGCTEVLRPDLGAGFFCDYLLRWWADQKAFGDNQYERENRLLSGGYKITTSLDIATQEAAFKYAQQRPSGATTPVSDSRAVMMAAVEPGTGRVHALATNRVFSNDQSGNGTNTNPGKRNQKGNYPNTTVPLVTGGPEVPGYQAGSVFKIFTVAAALEKGLTLDYTMNAPTRAKTKYIIDPSSPAACDGPYYCPQNASASMAGTHNMWGAFGRSVNTYFVPLQEQIGSENVVSVAKRLGIRFRAKGTAQNPNDYEFSENAKYAHQWGAFTLGVSATTPLDMATAWATLAADGKYCEPTPVLEILDRDGNKVSAGDPQCSSTPVIAPEVAQGAIDAARCPVGDKSSTSRCTGSTAGAIRGIVKRPVAGKTGTTDDDRTATMTVTTKQLAISGFMVDPDWPTHPRVGKHPIINNAVAFTLKDAMAGKPAVNFTAPPQSVVSGKQVKVPSVKCLSVSEATRKLSKSGFKPYNNNQQVASDCPLGTVAATNPSGRAVKGGAIELLISKGQNNAAPELPETSTPTRRRE